MYASVAAFVDVTVDDVLVLAAVEVCFDLTKVFTFGFSLSSNRFFLTEGFLVLENCELIEVGVSL